MRKAPAWAGALPQPGETGGRLVSNSGPCPGGVGRTVADPARNYASGRRLTPIVVLTLAKIAGSDEQESVSHSTGGLYSRRAGTTRRPEPHFQGLTRR